MRESGDLGTEAPHEADVARPEQAFVGRAALVGEQAQADSPMDQAEDGTPVARSFLAAMMRPHPCPVRHAGGPVRSGTFVRGASGEAFPGTDRQVEAVLRRRQRTGPARVEGARRLDGEVEVEDEVAGVRVAPRSALLAASTRYRPAP